MAKKGAGRPLQLGDDLPPHLLARLHRTMKEHGEHVAANQLEYPDPEDDSAVHANNPADFTHPTARRVRRRTGLRGAPRPSQNN